MLALLALLLALLDWKVNVTMFVYCVEMTLMVRL